MIQGITEFLPISSSAHLILVPVVTGWPDQGLVIDIAVHVGTLGAVAAYLWRDLWSMVYGVVCLLGGRREPGAALAGYLFLGTVPVVVAGFAMHAYNPAGIRSIAVIGWTTFGFGVLLYLADRLGMTVRRIEHFGFPDVLVIGFAQVLALIPGTSRSGITMTAARLLGFERPDSARFSMLLSIPTIVGAGVLAGLDLWRAGDVALTAEAAVASGLAFVAALVAVVVMMAWLRRATFAPFVVYRIVLGVALIVYAEGWIG